MSIRILGTELRRSSAAVIGALIAALGVAGLWSLVMSGQGELWDVQWTMLAGFQRIMPVLLWPLALGGGAWQARRERRCGMEELLGTTSLPTWRRTLPTAAAPALCLVLGYLVTLAAGATRVAGRTDYLSGDVPARSPPTRCGCTPTPTGPAAAGSPTARTTWWCASSQARAPAPASPSPTRHAP